MRTNFEIAVGPISAPNELVGMKAMSAPAASNSNAFEASEEPTAASEPKIASAVMDLIPAFRATAVYPICPTFGTATA